MVKQKSGLFVTLFSLVFGMVDSATGLLLIFIPEKTLLLMNIPADGHPPALIGFIGAFVLANGGLYLWALGFGKQDPARRFLKHVWLVTAWVRICVGSTTGVFILRGQLSYAWASVPATDLLVAMFQLIWIYTGRFPDHD